MNLKLIQMAREYIEINYRYIDQCQQVSSYLNTNYETLRKGFKNHVGISISKYLTLVRLLKAKDFLLKTNWKLYKIALEIGFKDVSYFAKIFKKYYQVPPALFRRLSSLKN